MDLLDQVTVGERGAPKSNKNAAKGETNPDNIKVCPSRPEAEQGTSRQYALRHLRKSRPDLHAKVLAGELSPHWAMIRAGFRREPTPLKELRKWWGKASEEERVEFVRDEVLVWVDGHPSLIMGWKESLA